MAVQRMWATRWRWTEERPERLAGAAMVLVVGTVGFFAAAMMAAWMRQAYGGMARLAVAAPLLLLGTGCAVVATRVPGRLARGVVDGRWTEPEVRRVRRVVSSRWWAVGYVAVLVLYLLALLAPSHGGLRAVAGGLLWPMVLMNGLRTAVREPGASQPGMVPWGAGKPIVSEHWGER